MHHTTVAAAAMAFALLPMTAYAGDREVVEAFLRSPNAAALSMVEARHHRHHGHHRHGHHRRHTVHGSISTFGRTHDRHVGVSRDDHEGVRHGIYEMVTRSAIAHGLPVALAHGIVRAESGYNCSAYNHGAQGLMQIKDASARSVGVSGGLRSCTRGLEAGMRYLRLAYEAARGNASVAATLYNRGLGARPTTSSYSRSVIRLSRS